MFMFMLIKSFGVNTIMGGGGGGASEIRQTWGGGGGGAHVLKV